MSKITAMGGKGKGLVWLAENADLGYQVPKFDIIDPSYHEDVLKQESLAGIIGILQTRATGQQHIGKATRVVRRLEDRCQELANQFNGKSVMVRSSAVLSEDSDRFSGAGIYDSFKIGADELTPDALLDTVLKVYASVNSDRAKQYRRNNNLSDERMEVIIQEFAGGVNGVVMSRLPARAGIIPVWWSSKTGAVVRGDEDATIHTIYITPSKNSLKAIFISDTNIEDNHEYFVISRIGGLARKLNEKYGRDFEAEFSADFDSGLINMLQIRLLTNICNKQIIFPDKEPILTGTQVMSVGEYIGPWVIPEHVKKGWNEPAHYAYMASKLDQLLPGAGMGADYNKLTPNKKAIVLTNSCDPGIHALTIANEQGIICVCARKGELTEEEFKMQHGYSRETLIHHAGEMGNALLQRPDLNISLKDLGNYVHVVSDGLKGCVYKATEQEARDFERNLAFGVTYSINPVTKEGDEKWWDLEFQIVPSNTFMPLDTIWMDFIEHMKQKTGKPLRFRGNDGHAVYSQSAEFEVYCAYFDPANRKEGIRIETGRSANQIADQQSTKQWFQEFTEKYKKGYVPPEKARE